MIPHHERLGVTVWFGDCIDVMRGMDADSVDSVVCDPPYSLGFMGRSWDTHTGPAAFQEWCRTWAVEAYRVLKPGGHLLAFGAPRSYHRLTSGIEDAGFDIRDSLTWLQGSGFPKSLDVGKAIDKAAGATREEIGPNPRAAQQTPKVNVTSLGAFAGTAANLTAPATAEARQWAGWGTALKPGSEPVVVARKPFGGTVAANVQRWGTGGINVDGCRVPGALGGDPNRFAKTDGGSFAAFTTPPQVRSKGRWPANVVLSHAGYALPDGTEVDECADGCVVGCPVRELDEQSGQGTASVTGRGFRNRHKSGSMQGAMPGGENAVPGFGDAGGASRFFPTFRYQAKAPTRERPKVNGESHPTVKPVAIVRWLVRLVTPPGGVVLDPFAGSGTTGEACNLEGFSCHLIENHEPYLPMIVQRLERLLIPS